MENAGEREGRRGGRRARWLALAAACAVAVAGYLTLRGDEGDGEPAAPASGFSIADGTERVYDLRWSSEAELQSAASRSGTKAFRLEARARLGLKYFVAAGGWDVAARLEEATLQLDGQPVELAPGLERPFSFHQQRYGYLSRFTFSPGLPEATRVLLRQVISRLQVVLSTTGAQAWRTREHDGLGLFRAGYDFTDPGVLRKQKLEYLPEPGDAGAAPAVVRQVVESETRLRLLPGGAGVESARVRETLRAREEGGFDGEEASVFEARLVDAEVEFAPSFAAFAQARDVRFQGAARAALPTPSPAGDAPASLQDALAAFAELFATDRARAEAAVLTWLRSRPEAPGELLRLLDASSRGRPGPLDAGQQATLFRLLARAGTSQSLDALLSATVDPSYALRTRRMAIGHMDQVPTAESRQVDALFALQAGRGLPEGRDGAELGQMALFAAGALGHHALASPEVSAQVVQELQARLAAARDEEAQVELLLAMGNCGDERLLPALQQELVAPSPRVREAAARALRRVETDLAPLLTSRYAQEADPRVRAALLEVLGRQAPTEELLAWIRDEALRAGDVASRLALVDLLGATLPKAAANEETLRRLLASAPGREVEQAILRYIPPRPSR